MVEPPLVVVADPIDAEAIARLRSGPCRVLDASAEPAGLEAVLAGAWGLVVRSRTKVTAALIARAPQLRLIARAGVGLDNVDVAAARARGIEVVNVPQAATASVAELTVTFYLMLVRGLLPSIAATKAGRWEKGTHGHELAGRTVGFVGYGRIAREVARRLGPFGVRTLAHDPFLTGAGDGTELVSLDRLLSEADIVSVHATLTAENRHLIGAAQFARMRRGAFLVNVARGALVDEAALLEALRRGQLGGAALDVYETEPPTRGELLADPRVLCTPHVGASTEEAQRRAGAGVVDEVLRALPGGAAASAAAVAPEAR
jgi:D-3-phosphoglycerate dehydrogenase